MTPETERQKRLKMNEFELTIPFCELPDEFIAEAAAYFAEYNGKKLAELMVTSENISNTMLAYFIADLHEALDEAIRASPKTWRFTPL